MVRESLKSIAIKDYLSKIDFRGDDWSISRMSSDIQKVIGEIPAIDVVYKKDVIVSEFNGTAKEIKKISKISIIFTDLDDKMKKLDILI